MDSFAVITICLIVSFLLSELVARFKYPRILGQIMAGMVFSIPIMQRIFSPESLADIEFLAHLGVIFLFLMIGLEINLKKLREISKNALILAAFCIIIPFMLGFYLILLMGYDILTAVVVGVCLALTAEATNVKVLMDLNLFNSKIGQVMFGAGLIDDLFGVIAVAIILAISSPQTPNDLYLLPVKLFGFIAIVLVIFKVIPRFLYFVEKENSRVATFSSVLILGLTITVLAEQAGLGHILGAFLAGVIIQLEDKRLCQVVGKIKDKECPAVEILRRERDSIKELNIITFSFIIPFFFIFMGLHFNFGRMLEYWPLVLLIISVAFVGKILGALASKFFTSFSWRQSLAIGWGMNARGAIELVIAEIARANGLIPIEIYSAIVAMAILTTFAFPLAMRYYSVKYRKELV